ncbi:hypothetical protein A2V61_01000 [Candidatus Woesebacteria bacterium RBG_19FT_COMBO_47_8]|nr:MAG: hypothetical protein A2V61_01000 [Candidatus Woesebacteria bacterium RBG_19FT_COMBO_47_8]
MDPGAYKEVKEIKSDMYIYAEDPTEKYPICECVLLPKEEELKAGAEKNGIDVDDYKPGIGVEALLDRLVKLPEFKKRFLGVVCFTGGTDVTRSKPGKAVRALACVVVVLIVLAGTCKSPTDPELRGGVLATFQVRSPDARYSILITNEETIREIYALKNGQSDDAIPNGLVVRGAVSYNKPWSWHIDSEDIHMAFATIEINDGNPSMVEAGLDNWAGRYFGPWGARLISLKDYR